MRLAMVALAVPVSAGWLQGIWTWPQDIYVFRPIFCVLVGGYAFMVLRNLEGVGFRLVWRKQDVSDGLLNLLAFSHAGHPPWHHAELYPSAFHRAACARARDGTGGELLLLFIGIYLTVAIPEELLFRGILQNLLVRTIRQGPTRSLRPADCLGGVRRRASAPCPRPQLALCHSGHAGGNLLRECLPHPSAPVRFRSYPRAGGYDMAFLVLKGLKWEGSSIAGLPSEPASAPRRIRTGRLTKAQ